MRKRSGAMCADDEETYLKLAKLAQNTDSLYYSDTVQFPSQYDKLKIEQSSMPDLQFNQQQQSPQLMFTNNLSDNNIIYEDFEFNLSQEEFQLENDEKDCLNYQDDFRKKITVNIMVLGDSRINKKMFIDSCFNENVEGNQINNNHQEYCLDLIIKEIKMNENSLDCTCKFWIKNLDEIKFDSIVQAYYKSINSFIFLYDENSPASYYQLSNIFENIINIRAGLPFHAVLLTIHSDQQLQFINNNIIKNNNNNMNGNNNNINNFQAKYLTSLNNFQGNNEVFYNFLN